MPVPIPGNPLGYTLVYALDSPNGPVLIDAGWQHPEAWEALSAGLAGLGADVADVYGVILTHHHPDHAGLAGRVREASGAWIAMHAADISVIRKFRRVRRESGREWELAALRSAGASDAEIGQAKAWDHRIDPPAIPDRELADGEFADLPGRRLRVIWTPGHSPGHICLHLEDGDRLFTGDHVLPKITPNIGIYAFEDADTNPLADFLASLAKVAKIGAKEALPAHEHRFTDVRARIDTIAAHHEDRLAEVSEILHEHADAPARTPSAPGGTAAATPGAPNGTAADGAAAVTPGTVTSGAATPGAETSGATGRGDVAGSGSRSVTLWEVASRMHWNVPWADMHPMLRRLAAGEAAAHLRLLEERGLAGHVPGTEPIRYHAASRPDPG